MVTPAAEPVIVVVAASVRVSGPLLRVMVCRVLNTVLVKLIVSGPRVMLAWPTAQRRLPGLALSRGLVTRNVDGTVRSSSVSRPRRARRGVWRLGRVAKRENRLPIQERIVMGTS